jgi:hypothetical protein
MGMSASFFAFFAAFVFKMYLNRRSQRQQRRRLHVGPETPSTLTARLIPAHLRLDGVERCP